MVDSFVLPFFQKLFRLTGKDRNFHCEFIFPQIIFNSLQSNDAVYRKNRLVGLPINGFERKSSF